MQNFIKYRSVQIFCARSLLSGSCIFIYLLFQTISLFAEPGKIQSSRLYIGRATVDITPILPVALAGQFHLRIATEAETPLTANILVIEGRENNRLSDLAIMVSCDVLYVPTDLVMLVRRGVKERLPALDVSKIILNATHTHTAPVLREEGEYLIPGEGVTQVKDYRRFFVKQVVEGIIRAWNQRSEGSVAWGFSYAVVGYNRRVSYADGTAGMNSKTNLQEFRNLEGPEDHDINTLFFRDKAGTLVAIVIGVASPAQEVEGRSAVNADYWHPIREEIRRRFGNGICVLGWVGAAGDLSPHLRYRKSADDRMRELRGLSRLNELARRILMAVEEAYEAVKADFYSEAIFIHKTEALRLPERQVTERNFADARTFVSDAKSQILEKPKVADGLYRRMTWEEETLKRYERQQENPELDYVMDLHVIRLGDIAVCTNEFELFSDYGIRIQARSKALQTFVVQLAGSPEWGAYLPSQKAVNGGAYSAVIHSSRIGPEGGQVLVDKTVRMINMLWPD